MSDEVDYKVPPADVLDRIQEGVHAFCDTVDQDLATTMLHALQRDIPSGFNTDVVFASMCAAVASCIIHNSFNDADAEVLRSVIPSTIATMALRMWEAKDAKTH